MELTAEAPSKRGWWYAEVLREVQQYDGREAVSRLWTFAGGMDGRLAGLSL